MTRLHIPAPTWIALKTEFCSGAGTLRELAEKYAVKLKTAESRARREGWTRILEAKVAELNAASDKAIEIVAKHRSEMMPAMAQDFVCKVSAQAHGLVDNLSQLSVTPARTVAECSQRAEALERINKIGRATYQLDDGSNQKCPVNIHILAQISDLAFPQTESEVIETHAVTED